MIAQLVRRRNMPLGGNPCSAMACAEAQQTGIAPRRNTRT